MIVTIVARQGERRNRINSKRMKRINSSPLKKSRTLMQYKNSQITKEADQTLVQITAMIFRILALTTPTTIMASFKMTLAEETLLWMESDLEVSVFRRNNSWLNPNSQKNWSNLKYLRSLSNQRLHLKPQSFLITISKKLNKKKSQWSYRSPLQQSQWRLKCRPTTLYQLSFTPRPMHLLS